MPDRYLKPWMRRWAWPFTIGLLFALAITTTTITIVVYFVRDDVIDLNQAHKTTEVATCYAAARGRPGLIVILRVIAGSAGSEDRLLINSYIDRYQKNTPTLEECAALAVDRGLDPKDFPAPDINQGR